MGPTVDLICAELYDLACNIHTSLAHSCEDNMSTFVQVDISEHWCNLCYSGHSVSIPIQYYSKLRKLFELTRQVLTEKEPPAVMSDNFFHASVFSLEIRQKCALFNAGCGLPLPKSFMEALRTLFGVSMECFSSPKTCYYPFYCSTVSANIYSRFGCVGPFLEFYPLSGSFEAHLSPWIPELATVTASHIECLLASVVEPLSFAVVLPTMHNASCFLRSRFLRSQKLLGQNANVVFLQNEQGAEYWPTSEERLISLAETAHGLVLN